ncbi:MAG: ROK family protein [Candidatus Dormibacteria bacterium]
MVKTLTAVVPGEVATTPGIAPGMLRQVNRSAVERLLRERGPLSRTDLARLAGLAKPTVSAIVTEMLDEGLVRETGARASSIGRRPILLEYQSAREFVVGVQLGVNRTVVMAANSSGAEVCSMEAAAVGRDGDLSSVASAVLECLKQGRVPRRRLAAVGVCVPGMVDISEGVCVHAPNLGWRDVPVRAQLEGILEVPVHLTNVTHAAAVAEAEEGAARGSSDVVLLYAGTGIGCGILSGGRIFRGGGGMSGEVGHSPIPGRSEQCACGRQGCLEAVAGAAALVRAYRKARPEWNRRPHDGALALAQDAAAGNAIAAGLLAEAGVALGVGAAWLVNLFNPQVLVLAGGLMEAGDVLVEPLQQTLAKYALPGHLARVNVVHSELGRKAYVRGAVLLARGQTTSHYRAVFAG